MAGVDTKFKGEFYEVLLSVSHVPELNRVEEKEGGLLVGAAVSLNTLQHKLEEMVHTLPGQWTLMPVWSIHIPSLYVHHSLSLITVSICHHHVLLVYIHLYRVQDEGILGSAGDVEVVCRAADKEHCCEISASPYP